MKNCVEANVMDVFKNRCSTYHYDSDCGVSKEDLNAVFQAARWAMSAYNEQPWQYIVGVRDADDGIWEKVLSCLVEPNQQWAQNAPVLALAMYKTHYDFNGELNGTAMHDLGAASAFLTIEATQRGMSVHQMGGILPDKIRETFDVKEGWVPLTGLAMGYEVETLETPERTRKPLSEVVLGAI